MVVEDDGLELVAVLDDQRNGDSRVLGGGDGGGEPVGRGGLTVDGDDLHAHGQARLEGRAVPLDAADLVALAGLEAQGIGEVVALQLGVQGLHIVGGLVGEGQAPAAARQAVQRGAGVRTIGVQTGAQEGGPIAGDHAVQGRDYILERIGGGRVAAILDAVEGAGEVVERLAAIRLLPDQGVDVEPDQLALGIVVLVALPRQPALGLALADDRVVGGVLKSTPLAADARVIGRRRQGQGVHRLLRGQKTRTGGDDLAVVLSLALIDPQQAVLQGRVEVGHILVGGAAPFAVPGMVHLVAEQVAVGQVRGPAGEEGGIDRVFGTAVMLQPDAAQLVRHGDQEVVVVEVTRAIEAVHLRHQIPQNLNLLVRGVQAVGLVGDDVGPHGRAAAGIEVDLAIVDAGEDGTVDQDFQIDRLEGLDVAVLFQRLQRRAELPAGREFDGGLDHDVSRPVTGRIEQHLLPLKVQHLRRHCDAALGAGGRRKVLQLHLKRGRAGGNHDVVGEGAKGVAHPFHPLAAGGDLDSRKLGDRADRAMVAGQPFREIQHHRPGLGDGNGLGHGEDALRQVGGVDIQLDHAGIGHVLGVRDRRQGRGQGGGVGRGLLRQGGRGGRDEQKRQTGDAKTGGDHHGLSKPSGGRRDSPPQERGRQASAVIRNCTALPKTRAMYKKVQFRSVFLHRTKRRRGWQIVLSFRVVRHAAIVAYGMVVDLGYGLQIPVQSRPAPRLDQFSVDHRLGCVGPSQSRHVGGVAGQALIDEVQFVVRERLEHCAMGLIRSAPPLGAGAPAEGREAEAVTLAYLDGETAGQIVFAGGGPRRSGPSGPVGGVRLGIGAVIGHADHDARAASYGRKIDAGGLQGIETTGCVVRT